ncbi:MAG: zinc ribbon domain-containing protein [Candidatus Bathyarchaeia archaeon]
MSGEEKISCPSCGALVSKQDVYCRKCRVNLVEYFRWSIPPTSSTDYVPEEVYQRKLTVGQRLSKLLTAPSEAMSDIALAPDYKGVFVIITLQFILIFIWIPLSMQKIEISGPHAHAISNLVSNLLVAAAFIALPLGIVRWLIKSLIVKYACDNKSDWSFRTAASITGYAYLPELITGILEFFVVWFMLPTFHLETSNLDAARRTLTNYQTQLMSVRVLYSLPVLFFGLLWKSYLGGLGAYCGTKGKCTLRTGFTIFLVLGLVGILISFLI